MILTQLPKWIAQWLNQRNSLGVLLLLILPLGLFAQDASPSIQTMRKKWYNPKVSEAQRLEAGKNLQEHYQSSADHKDSVLLISREMISYGKKKGVEEWVFQGMFMIGNYHFESRDLKQALVVYKQMERRPSMQEFSLYSRLGLVYGIMGQLDSAEYCLKKALKVGRKAQIEPTRLGGAHGNLGKVYELKGNYLEAIEHYQQVAKIGTLTTKIQASLSIGSFFTNLGLINEARSIFKQGMKLAKEAKEPETVLNGYMAMIRASKDLKEARSLFEEAITLTDSFPNNPFEVKRQKLMSLAVIGSVFLDSLQYDEASPYYEQALPFAQALKDQSSIDEVRLALARIKQGQGRHRESLQLCEMILTTMEEQKAPSGLYTIYGVLAQNHIALNHPELALQFLQKRDQQKAELDDKAQIKEVIAQYIRRQNEKKQAALKLAKENAEKLAVATRAKARLNYWVLGLLSLLLAVVVVVYYTFYKQKKTSAEQLAQINQLLEGEKEKLLLSYNKLKRFSGVVSHDILSNLDLILSTGNVLVGARPNAENLNKYYTLTQNTGRQLKEYCLGLLAEAKASPDTALADIGDPNTVLNKVMERFGPALQEKGFTVEVGELPSSRLPLSVVEQVLQNLLSNASRYASDTPNPHLQIGSGIDEQGNLCWYVADNGPGQAAEINRVLQGEQASSAKGQGAGLNLLQATLKDYGWSLQAEAVDGGGVKFVVGTRG